MRYILAEKSKAVAAGFLTVAHRCNTGYMIVNENEVRHTDRLSGTLEERAAALGGEVLKEQEIWRKIKHAGKYKF